MRRLKRGHLSILAVPPEPFAGDLGLYAALSLSRVAHANARVAEKTRRVALLFVCFRLGGFSPAFDFLA